MIGNVVATLFLFFTTVCCKSVNTGDSVVHIRQTRDVGDALAAEGLFSELENQDKTSGAAKRQFPGFPNSWVGNKRYGYFDSLANGLVGKRQDGDPDAMDKRYILDNLTGLVGKRYYMMDSLADGLVGKRYYPMDSLATSLIGKRGYYSKYGSRDSYSWKRPFDSLASSLIGKRSVPNTDEH